MNIAQHLERFTQATPDRSALIFNDEHYSYTELNDRVNQVALGLEQLGIVQGDRVAIMLPNIPAFVFAYYGILKLGAIAVSINPTLKQEELRFILEDSGSKAIVINFDLAKLVIDSDISTVKYIISIDKQQSNTISFKALLEKNRGEYIARTMNIDDPAAIVYSSGTTGFPKGVTLSHGNVISNMQAKQHHCGITSEDKLLLFVPLFHCFGQNAILNSGLYAGGTIVLHQYFNKKYILESINQHQITMFFAVSTIFVVLIHELLPQDIPSVRYFFSAASTMPTEIAQRWQEKFGRVIYEGYGLTETSPFASYNHSDEYRLGSIGSPIEHVEMAIVDLDSGEHLEPGVKGELVIRGPNVMLGYWNRPEDTALVIKDGWLHTGDIGMRDQDNYFYLVDRLKDMINVAGLKVYPAEVENVIYQHAAVAEAAVYGVPDSTIGERVMAQIVVKPDATLTEREIFALCRKSLASYKVPSKVHFVEQLPKNATGKILKRVLRENAS